MKKMPNQNLVSYGFWDLITPEILVRSRLYSLEPYGLGAPQVESLTSYIARLAEAHCVSVRTLITEELLVPLNRRQVIDGHRLSSFWKTCGQSLNSTGLLAKEFAKILEALTLCTDLSSLTLLPWADALSRTWLLRSKRAWCPDCFMEWRAIGQPIYEPLIWQIRAVTFCPRHQKLLVRECQYEDCHAEALPLSGNSRVGYCPKCSRWLGIPAVLVSSSLSREELLWHDWVNEMVGKLLTYNTYMPKPYRLDNLRHLVSSYLEQVAWKRDLKTQKKLQVSKDTLKAWRKGQQKPQLESLLRLCYRCNVSLYELFTLPLEVFSTRDLTNRSLPESLGQYQKQRAQIRFDHIGVKQALESILANEEPPPSMYTVAKRLGRTPKDIRVHFPDLCKAISRKYTDFRKKDAEQRRQIQKEAIQRAVLKIHSTGKYPNYERVKSLLSENFTLQYNLIHKYWYEALQELELDNLD